MAEEETWIHDATEMAYKNGYNKAITDSSYMLISVADREIVTETFPTYEKARATMLNELMESMKYEVDFPFNVNIEEYEDEDLGFGYSKWGAYYNGKIEFDWSIVHTVREGAE